MKLVLSLQKYLTEIFESKRKVDTYKFSDLALSRAILLTLGFAGKLILSQ